MTQARVLVIAGSDSGGGAGIQADIKTVTCLGGFAMTAVTAVTVQNTRGVFGVHMIPPEVVAAQMRVVIEDLGVDVVKIGMLGDVATILAVADGLEGLAVPVVLDPVMVSTSGSRLLADDAVAALRERLLPLATVVTPNVPELIELTGLEVDDAADMLLAARELLEAGPMAVLAKGGHLDGERLTDWLVWKGGQRAFAESRIDSRDTHGTGCTLASALAVSLAQGLGLEDACARARGFVRQGLLQAPGFGEGAGPLGFYPFE
ncbi:bifunctional hydroxymethylpyrimidine kinase/phosphomethylpyrimidine kinase [Polymorphobacter sp.]|uniref:bifunctional hydroxymethylpyrimidine kinase/phosphomethylpyrimidine kinase n=1 Tax=Polymorphobacter sp. TaxID=1909290 RepID=UPI003F700CAC